MSTVISEDTRAAVDQAEPDFSSEPNFTLEDPPAATPKRGGPGRGHKGPMGKRSHHKKPSSSSAIGTSKPIVMVPEPPAEPPKALIRGCGWILRNVVTVMKEGYGWTEPDDYEEWLVEASQFGAACVQKHFPDYLDRWGDEILLLAMMLLWVTPNVSRKLRERQEQADRDVGQEGKREDHKPVSFAQSA